jgi:hypothetical protein
MTPQAQPHPTESTTLIEVHAAIGQSLILYQHLELMLKSILPFIRTQDQKAREDPFAEMKQLLGSKKTMGLLIERLKTSIEITHLEEFAKYLEQVVDNRNELVHQFLTIEFGLLESEEARDQAFSYLDQRYEFARPLLEMLGELSSTFDGLMAQAGRDPRRVQQTIAVRVPRVP